MSAEASRVKAKGGQPRFLRGARRRNAGGATRYRLAVDQLEARELLATLPPSTFAGGTAPISAVTGQGNMSTPTVAMDPLNPQKLVAVWTRNDPANLGPLLLPTETVNYATSTDGGKTWLVQGNTNATPGGYSFPSSFDPTTSNPIVLFAQYSDASVAFDRNENFYILLSGHQAGNAAGVLLLDKFSFTTGTPQTTFVNKIVTKWTGDQASNPILAVDSNLPTFTDTDINGVTRTQNDPNSGNVYVGWVSTDIAPATNPGNFNPNRIEIVASVDGGNTFSGIQTLNNNGNFGSNRPATPTLAISQGSAPRAAGTNGPSDPGSPGVSPGQVSVVYDDYGVGATATPPFDAIVNNRITGATNTKTFTNNGGPISDAGPGNPANSPVTTSFPITVNVNDPNFSVSDLTVSMAITHPALNELRAVLVPPAGSNLPQIVLFNNQTDAAGNVNQFVGISGANLGIATSGEAVGTTFDDNATRNIVDIAPGGGRGASAPYIGHFQPEGGSFSSRYKGAIAGAANSNNSINGQWTLQITDFRNSNVGFLRNVSVTLNSGLSAGVNTTVGDSFVRAKQSGNQVNSPAASFYGIAATPVIASDNTLGAYSPYEGRIYVAFVDRNQILGNPADNTDIFLSYSDDGGVTWTRETTPVNDDLAIVDGYSEGSTGLLVDNTGRAQFQPNIAVDNVTGTLVLSWYDAREDGDRARVVTYLTTSIDGGQSFSKDVYANDSQKATDAITGQQVILAPIPDNQSGVNADLAAGFGTHQSLVVYGGQAHPVWSSNLNGGGDAKEPLGIRTHTMTFAAGPRIISTTSGPVGLPGDTLNGQPAADGTPTARAFRVIFDRPVDPTTFSPSDVRILFQDTGPRSVQFPYGPTGGFVPVSSVVPDPAFTTPFGVTQFTVNFAPRSGVGTYSLAVVGTSIQDDIRTVKNAIVPVGAPVTAASSNVPLTVGPNVTVDSNLVVNSFPLGQVLSSLTVTVALAAPDASSLTLTLISPAGTRITLASHAPFVGAGGQGFGVDAGGNVVGTTFDDKAATGINQSFAPFIGTFRPVSPLSQLIGQSLNGNWTLEVNSSLTPTTATLKSWSLSIQAGQQTTVSQTGNKLDQNANAIPGQASDFFANPTPVSYANGPFTGPFISDTLPLIVPGPHVLSTSVPGAPATPDNLVLDSSVSSLDIKFDRDMNPATITAASILQVMGPAGPITGPFTVTPNPQGSDPNAASPRTYRISFPKQTLSGTYTVTLASSVTDARGNALDTNLNAGVDLLRGVLSGPTATVTYNSTTPTGIPDARTVVSSLTINDLYQVQGVTVQLNITHANDPDLTITLVSPNNVAVVLVNQGTGTTGTKANFTNTIFDDTAATSIANGGAPFFGRFKPASPLSALNGLQIQGTWKLIITDNPANPNGIGGQLTNWSLSFQKGSPASGLGEPVADQATVSFRIFNSAATNPLASTTWTAVGPGSMVDANSQTVNNGFSGQIGAIAVDPSDTSGNTVYVAGAHGGIWKTSNFLTTDPKGPTYVPLTDFGPNSGMLISSIALFPRNNDPRQTIVIAGTGTADTTFGGTGDSVYGANNLKHGVGFLKSLDGGSTWTLLDSSNNNLPFAFRDHLFSVGTTNGFFGTGTEIMKVVADPRPTPAGGVILYAAVKSPFASNDGGLYRSVDTGQTWQKLSDNSLGDATDVILDYNSGTVDAVSNPTGNVNIIYAAFPGNGVYISPNRGQVLNKMAGGNVDPLIVDTITNRQVPVNNGANAPTGFPGSGRIILAKPNPLPSTAPNADIQNTLYEGWLYAAVAGPFGTIDGLYLTKDNGQTWTKLHNYGLPNPNNQIPKLVAPTNDGFLNPDYDVTSSQIFQHGDYDISLVVDANNPNIVYLGGTANGNQSGLIRIDATRVYDSHAVVSYDGTHFDVGAPLQINSTGRAQVDSTIYGPSAFIGTTDAFSPARGPYLNLIQDPTRPFQVNSTVLVRNVAAFTNDGSGVRWTTLDTMLQANAGSAVPSSNVHRMITYADPLTGKTRLIVGDDEGVFTGVVNADGTLNPGIGTATAPTYSRNGNLQLGQFFYGASQPSLNSQVSALFYANGIGLGQTGSDPNILTNGNITGYGSTNGSPLGAVSLSSADQAGTGVGVSVDQNHLGSNNLVYRYYWPKFGGNATDFFQVSTGGGAFISRTLGLVQTANDPQWPGESPVYANGLTFGNFTVNPLNGDQVMISSAAGRIFSTSNQGQFWLSIGEPGSLDGSYAPALTFGAPDPKGPAGVGNLNNFLYAGTVNGNIFVTQTGGGGTGNAWTKISTGLDGSPVVKIIADPTRGSHDAYAVTQKGVYYTPDSTSLSAAWTNITSNLFGININAFNNPSFAAPALTYLTSLQADWRYVIPNDPKGVNPTGTHPILYVSGDTGVYRSLDNGATWAAFPNKAFDNSPADGGYLPHVEVNDLNLSIGAIDPTTGRPVAQPGDPNNLLATTYGRGQFTIRLAPLVFPSTLALDTKLPAPSGSVSGVDNLGRPIVTVAQPVIDGLSEQTAFGNKVRITILDLTDPANPHVIGGYDPGQGSSNNPTDVPANWTDSTGHFQVQVYPTGFTTNGVKTIGIQATDASGTQGNIGTLTFVLNAHLISTTAPAAPQIALDPSSDSSGGKAITNITSPVIDGTTDPNVPVQLYEIAYTSSPTGTPVPLSPPVLLGSTTSDNFGKFSIQLTNLPDGKYVVQAKATNPVNGLFSTGNLYNFQIKTTAPTIAPVLVLNPADDSGIKGDNVTSVRFPHFINTNSIDPYANVSIYLADSTGKPSGPVLATATADVNGKFSIQLPFALSNGPISVVVSIRDAAGNPTPPAPALLSNPVTVSVISVTADYTGSGQTTPALFRRGGNGAATWLLYGVQPPSGIQFGGSTVDIPFTGDFDGDGKADLALYRPSTNTWYINRSSLGFEQFNLGGAGSIPAVGDFDGDGKLDTAAYDPTTGIWSVSETTAGYQTLSFNADPNVFKPQPGDVPVPGHYVAGNGGVNNPDVLAVYRPSNGTFYIDLGKGAGTFDNIVVENVAGWKAGDLPVPGNYDDSVSLRQTEPAVYDPSTGTYLILGPSNVVKSATFNPGDIPAPGDYEGVGRTEPAVYHVTSGVGTFLVNSPQTKTVPYGLAGDIPVTAPLYYRNIIAKVPTLSLSPSSDTGFAGDNVTSVRRPFFTGVTDPNVLVDLIDPKGNVLGTGSSDATGTFNVQLSPSADLPNGTYVIRARAHGPVNNIGPVSAPVTVKLITVAGDYLGIGATQPALFRRLSAFDSQFFVVGSAILNGRHFGAGSLDIPVAADLYGDGKTDLVVFRPSTGQWFSERAADGYAGTLFSNAIVTPASGDIAVTADFNGTGKDTPAIFRPSTGQWFILGQPGSQQVVPGHAGDIPVPGNYDNTGSAELAVFRSNIGQWVILGPGGNAYSQFFGNPNDVPVPGAYDASATSQQTELGLWRPVTGQYFVLAPGGGTRLYQFKVGDIPAPGDYEGTGITEPAVFRPSTGQYFVVSPGQMTPHLLVNFGAKGDIPTLAPYTYRALTQGISSTGIRSASVALGTTTLGQTLGTASGTSAGSTPAVTVDVGQRTRPRQVLSVSAKHPHGGLGLFLQHHATVKKNHIHLG